MMESEVIRKENIYYLSTDQYLRNICFSDEYYLFTDLNGKRIHKGDTVEYKITGNEIFPYIGDIANYNGFIQICSFCTILNRHKTYRISE